MLWRPLASYYLLLASTALLLGFGIVMVWSSSYVVSTQVSFAVVAEAAAVAGDRAAVDAGGHPAAGEGDQSARLSRRCSAHSCLLVAVLVPGLGVSANGATRWVNVGGPFTIQPSEFAKLGLVLWGADLLARKQKYGTLDTFRRMLIPLMPVTLIVLALIDKEHDLGTMLDHSHHRACVAVGRRRADAVVRRHRARW